MKLKITAKQTYIAIFIVMMVYFITNHFLLKQGIYYSPLLSYSMFALVFALGFYGRFIAPDKNRFQYAGFDLIGIPEKYHRKAQMISYVLMAAMFLFMLIWGFDLIGSRLSK